MFGLSVSEKRKELGTDEILQNQMAFFPHADSQFSQMKASLESLTAKAGILERKIDYTLGVVNVINENLQATKKMQEELDRKLDHTINILTAEVAEVEIEGMKDALYAEKMQSKNQQLMEEASPAAKDRIKKHGARTISIAESQLKVMDSINKITNRLTDAVRFQKPNKTRSGGSGDGEGIEI